MAEKQGPRPSEYARFLGNIKGQIREAQLRAAQSVNEQRLAVYWEIGKSIAERQEEAGWGDGIIDQLAADLRREFPTIRGFSRPNLFRMRQWFFAYRDAEPNCLTAMRQLPWTHNILILSRLSSSQERLWYAEETLRNGWSKRVLNHQIDSQLYERQALVPKSHNFDRTLPPQQSDLAKGILKDPYHLDFLSLGPKVRERDLQRALIDNLRRFLLELGSNFAFLGSEYPLSVGDKSYFIDLLFYHIRLRCLVALELKMESFKPEHSGKMNFYLSVLDDQVRHPDDRPSIGIILCRSKDVATVEYALRDTRKPIGVSAYRLTSVLPPKLRDSLPSVKELEDRLRSVGGSETS